MKWKKKGLVFVPDGKFEWSKTHAQVPVVDVVNKNVWRIYYATRSVENISRTSYIEVEAHKPENILYIHNEPLLQLGRLGTFDEHGIMPSCIITVNNKKYLYYIGWSQRKSVPYQNSIGLAISDDEGRNFSKYAEGPVLGIHHSDPFFTGTIFITQGAGFYEGYYLSCVEWKIVENKPEPLYVLKYATSLNGIDWQRNNTIAISFKDESEGGLVSATVIKHNNEFYMWYGYRNYFDFRNNSANAYKIGFAKSCDGIKWERDDAISGIEPSTSGWDSEMISYPYIIESDNKKYLFYNGNHFGKTGFGYAEWVD